MDGDDTVDLLETIEVTFGVHIGDEERAKIWNVGELYDLVWLKVGLSELPAACFSAHTFYAVRRGLGPEAAKVRITPGTRFSEFTPKRSNQDLWQRLEASTNLRLRCLTTSPLDLLSLLTLIVGMIVLINGWVVPGGLAVLGGVVGMALFGRNPDCLPFRSSTPIREFVDDLTARNFTQLARRVGGFRERDLWVALTNILTDFTGKGAKGIGHETVFV